MSSKWTDPRPLSPHLQIWRWHPTMLSSILHRATGIALFVSLILIAGFLALLAAGPSVFMDYSGLIYSPFGAFIWFGFLLLVSYHLLNGVRHMVWDSGKLLNPQLSNRLSMGIIAAALLIAALLSALTFHLVGGA